MTAEPALLDDRFGAPGLYDYVDAGKATENIKALLEGAFEDEDDKPRTRRRKKKAEATVESLADKLQDLEVKNSDRRDDETKTDEEAKTEDKEEEEEEDDGTVEGLRVKLLPHQVEGVEVGLSGALSTLFGPPAEFRRRAPTEEASTIVQLGHSSKKGQNKRKAQIQEKGKS